MLAQRFLGGGRDAAWRRQRRKGQIQLKVGMEIRQRLSSSFCLWLEWRRLLCSDTASVLISGFLLSSFYAHAGLGMSSGCGISLAFKAFRACAFECSGARSIYQGCCFALLCSASVALFQCSSYRQFDIACQQRTREREATTIATTTNNNNNNGKVNTQSTKHLFTAITEIFLHSTWN